MKQCLILLVRVLCLVALFTTSVTSLAAPVIFGTYYSSTNTHTSAGVYLVSQTNNRTRLIRTLWSKKVTASGSHNLTWDGFDDEGNLLVINDKVETIDIRILAADITYTWEGAIGNSIAQTGPRVPKGYSTIHGISIVNDVAVLCAGYGERIRTMFAFNASGDSPASSSFRSLGHMDYHSDYSICATDGITAVFFNNGVPAPQASYYHDNATFIVGYDLLPNLFDPSVPPVCEHNYTIGGRLSCQDGTGQTCNVMWDGCNGHEQTYSSALDWNQSSLNSAGTSYTDAASGIVLQPNGPLMIVLHGISGELRTFDKQTGARIRVWSDPAFLFARNLAVSNNNSVWAITADRGVCRFDGLDSSNPLTRVCPLTMSDILDADVFSISPDGTRILVTDVDPKSQQVKLFDASSGMLLHTYGVAGGYLSPDAAINVTFDRFWFSPSQHSVNSLQYANSLSSSSVVAFTSDGASFWVSDHGNRRLLRLSILDGTLLDSIGWLLCSYKSAVLAAEPSRVFSNYLEFSVDHTLPVGDPNAWSLVTNWGAGLNSSFFAWDYNINTCDGWAFAGFNVVVNVYDAARDLNRTFSTVGYHPYQNNCTDSTVAVVELVRGGSPAAGLCPSAGPVSQTGGLRIVHIIDAQPHAPYSLSDSLGEFEVDGTLRFPRTISESGSNWQGIFARLPVFDANGCVSWIGSVNSEANDGTPSQPVQLIASFNISTNASQSLMARGSMAQPRMPTTTGGFTAIFDASRSQNGGFHLGAVAAASDGSPGTDWAWKASPWGTWHSVDNITTLQPGNISVNLRYIDPSDVDGRFGADDPSVNFAGSVVMAEGSNLFYGFYGEGWQEAEANQMLHWHESGLFLGQFGVPCAPYPEGNTIYASSGVAGNTFAPSLMKTKGADGLQHLYYLNNEEVEHGGVHRWRIDGIDSVRFLAFTIQ